MEHYHSLEAASGFPWLPKKYTFQTLLRWAQGYFHGAKLKTKKIGGTLCTTEAWVKEFLDNLNAVMAQKDGRPIRIILLQLFSQYRTEKVIAEACKREFIIRPLEAIPEISAWKSLRRAVLMIDWSMEDFFAEQNREWDKYPYRPGGVFEDFFDSLFKGEKGDHPVKPNTAARQWLAYKNRPIPPEPKGVPFPA